MNVETTQPFNKSHVHTLPPEPNPADFGMEIPSDFRAPQLGLGD